MSSSKKIQDTENTNEWINWIEEKKIVTKNDITENTQFSNKQEFDETTLKINNNSELQELSQYIQYFDKINIKEVDPITVSIKQEKLLSEKGRTSY
ncbi:kinase-like domain-containing protein [Rhizophagus irregularis DAOM 181602=DAOM 197198]|nr:kinase-like domain-containing protein [Rhizophagus irregularis DAOM 181602=DAOM 197198]